MLIRKAAPEDRADIESIAQAAYACYLPRMDRKPHPMLADYGGHIANDEAYVLEDGDAIQGYAILQEKGDGLVLDNVGVRPASQKKGFGAALVEFACQEAARRGFASISLYTNKVMTENIAWYRKLGFRILEERMQDGYERIFFVKEP